MRRFFFILFILAISSSAFALRVRGGGAFNFNMGVSAQPDEGLSFLLSKSDYKSTGLGFNVGADLDLTDKLALWADFNMTFELDLHTKYVEETEWESAKDFYSEIKDILDANSGGKAILGINNISAGLGAAFKFDLSPKLDTRVGAGVYFQRIINSLKMEVDDVNYMSELTIMNLGVSLYANAEYKINDNLSAGITLLPQFGVYNIMNSSLEFQTNVEKESVYGFAFGFSMPVVIGASYSF